MYLNFNTKFFFYQRSVDEHKLHRRSSIDIFDKFDTNDDGLLDVDEMAHLFLVYRFSPLEAEYYGRLQVEMFDLDNNMMLDRWGKL